MGQVLHGSAKTTHAIRAELKQSQASVASLARKYGINEKTVLKWRKRQSVEDMPMEPSIKSASDVNQSIASVALSRPSCAKHPLSINASASFS